MFADVSELFQFKSNTKKGLVELAYQAVSPDQKKKLSHHIVEKQCLQDRMADIQY